MPVTKDQQSICGEDYSSDYVVLVVEVMGDKLVFA